MKWYKNLSVFIFIILLSFTSIAQENLIPLPQQISWKKNKLNLSKGVVLHVDQTVQKSELDVLGKFFKDNHIQIVEKGGKNPEVRLMIVDKLEGFTSKEAYQLNIDANGILLKAISDEGLFYGLQTLSQFNIQEGKISYAEIKDEPAFSFRGFLVDVGRNYEPIDMLKEQIDMMAKYKLNVLQFHFTEDIAWRLESKKYPGLTDAKIMTRWPGKYYTKEEFKDLIDYCKERHILFLPEIDMPGHSEAFERFFGVNMQSEGGIFHIKELLKEFSETYPELNQLHIGGDEVKITNKQFMPEVTKYVEDLGYKTYGWDPGSNLEPSTIRQLWMGGPKALDPNSGINYVDSKHLYINHMDPLETVTTLFFRQFAEQQKESAQLKGAILCTWPDRAVSKPEDMFLQSAIYPGMITFAERIWHGKGESGWKANLPQESSNSFKDFQAYENRLLVHKSKYFSNLPFPYVKQTDISWDLIGPFDNEGDLKKSFPIESNPFAKKLKVYKRQIGGTVILRHWWADVVTSAVDSPKVNSTYYARTKIWSDRDEVKPFWIGFQNLSRSYASDSPKKGEWDDLESKVYVNGNIVEPPVWKQAGEKGALEKPMIDEGYSFRPATQIKLKKGWNEVLIKLPVKDFKWRDWQNPVKWMFTFVPYY